MELKPAIFPYEKKNHVLLTWAQSMNGQIGYKTPTLNTVKEEDGYIRGQLKISCKESFHMTHGLRASFDAIMVGSGTVRNDNPSLTCRYPHPEDPRCLAPLHMQPIPIIIDSQLSLDYASLKVMDLARRRLTKAPWIVVAPSVLQKKTTDARLQERWNCIEDHGGRVFVRDQECPENWKDYVSLEKLQSSGASRIMVEGGANLLKRAFDSNAFDSLIVTIAPKVFSSEETTGISYLHNLNMNGALWIPCGTDILLTTYKQFPIELLQAE
ncbi:5-amino-6-(5-phosphoribosylamino) uracil reductase [Schizosaccharomyces cryophilus OY26]|uniref:2,5-diamino-6-ribosylamino-4(3H)-pyrimidinone 5'-phosphate reductase n=1 Tax=Schizosaccharomyces cryophilus (strain OY26 / ATCC MYA-4695 / CBS 11777 / NBRC 106824 / NRRL Y48691) TaxID=653667 RepID=S9W6Z1_SCHCR|nr:5-amino-6-(5-phosphoribosylamino) uracil reductase [Schizosaccharomyces cryophilus OY26]EPY53650.1 5-amino-6-(5-phosphoribosylamino) uracil reductase [Schizosaccharomyces cryophilus OY26]